MIKILGICASPRRGGNTEVLLDTALSGAASAGVAYSFASNTSVILGYDHYNANATTYGNMLGSTGPVSGSVTVQLDIDFK